MRICVIVTVLLAAGVSQAQDTPVFYSYKGDSGRTVYVNRFSMVPPEKRAKARAVDLSEVELHEELAESLADAVEDELRYLKDSDPCNEARTEEDAGAWRHVWHRHGPWLLASFATSKIPIPAMRPARKKTRARGVTFGTGTDLGYSPAWRQSSWC